MHNLPVRKSIVQLNNAVNSERVVLAEMKFYKILLKCFNSNNDLEINVFKHQTIFYKMLEGI